MVVDIFSQDCAQDTTQGGEPNKKVAADTRRRCRDCLEGNREGQLKASRGHIPGESSPPLDARSKEQKAVDQSKEVVYNYPSKAP